jgi:NAD(P)-dependent dehydrogenase (short-subunit alcohol dehydrogenase family)
MPVLNGADLTGKVALVVGGGSPGGIGFATAEAFAASGARVALADLPNAPTAATLARLPGTGHWAESVDVADGASVAALFKNIADRGGLDIVVNAAAILIAEPFLEVSLDSWERTFAVNSRGQFLIAHAAARAMVKRGKGGRIIMIASNVARIPRINNSSYAASKAAVMHLARAMAMELGPYNICVNALCPGSTATTMLIDNQARGDPRRLEGIIKGSVEQWRTGIPLGRLAEPADQAAMCLFLASEAGRHVTGQALSVDGGQTLF